MWHPPDLKAVENVPRFYGSSLQLCVLQRSGTAADVRGSRAALLAVVRAVTRERPLSPEVTW